MLRGGVQDFVLVFSVPPAAHLKDLVYTVSSSDMDKNTDFRVSLQAAAAPATLGDVHIERAGSQRWLVVNRPADQLWEPVREFWKERGFNLTLEQADLDDRQHGREALPPPRREQLGGRVREAGDLVEHLVIELSHERRGVLVDHREVDDPAALGIDLEGEMKMTRARLRRIARMQTLVPPELVEVKLLHQPPDVTTEVDHLPRDREKVLLLDPGLDCKIKPYGNSSNDIAKGLAAATKGVANVLRVCIEEMQAWIGRGGTSIIREDQPCRKAVTSHLQPISSTKWRKDAGSATPRMLISRKNSPTT